MDMGQQLQERDRERKEEGMMRVIREEEGQLVIKTEEMPQGRPALDENGHYQEGQGIVEGGIGISGYFHIGKQVCFNQLSSLSEYLILPIDQVYPLSSNDYTHLIGTLSSRLLHDSLLIAQQIYSLCLSSMVIGNMNHLKVRLIVHYLKELQKGILHKALVAIGQARDTKLIGIFGGEGNDSTIQEYKGLFPEDVWLSLYEEDIWLRFQGITSLWNTSHVFDNIGSDILNYYINYLSSHAHLYLFLSQNQHKKLIFLDHNLLHKKHTTIKSMALPNSSTNYNTINLAQSLIRNAPQVVINIHKVSLQELPQLFDELKENPHQEGQIVIVMNQK